MSNYEVIEKQKFDEERALYGREHLRLVECSFDGPADGESACKEAADIQAERCYFNLRYPFWHVDGLTIQESEMTQLCRAALWYSGDIEVQNTKLHGIKAFRECRNVKIADCDIISPEFGWSVQGLSVERSHAVSEYFLMRSKDITFRDVTFQGKYSFQYVENVLIENCNFDTKDAFWHAKNVTVRNSVIKGEYLAWYAENLTLENCKLIGTQPFCYCKGLKLIHCEMIDADLCLEKSEVEATLTAPILSIKNPASGRIEVPAVGELIMDDPKAKGEVVVSGEA
ncbi:MAG: DUF3737 family protein [Lachnospiraceae bacterium]|nr:DUF3737 family protein [Lachnospiraceae bacterium]